MDSQESHVPDLMSVLKTLSAYAPMQSSPTDAPQQNATSQGSDTSPTRVQPTAEHAVAKPPQALSNNLNLPNPSLITTWPTALKYVMRTIAQNEAHLLKIRRLIQSQHKHEKQWWDGREALLAKQSMRAEKKTRLDEVLRSVGGSVVTGTEVTSPEDDLMELDNYDKKVHRALSAMSRALDAELRDLDIPFFAIKHDLVEPAGLSASKQAAGPDNKTTISANDLVSLQRRMLDLLEDMCKE